MWHLSCLPVVPRSLSTLHGDSAAFDFPTEAADGPCSVALSPVSPASVAFTVHPSCSIPQAQGLHLCSKHKTRALGKAVH